MSTAAGLLNSSVSAAANSDDAVVLSKARSTAFRKCTIAIIHRIHHQESVT